MPLLPAADVSVSAQVRPAPPRSWMPSTSFASYISRQASMSSFSVNGSPTWTLGRRAGPSSSKVALARTLTPPMPSRPVLAPSSTTTLPTPRAARQLDAVDRHDAEAERVDERVALVARVEDDLAADVGQPQAVPVAADAGDDAGQHALGVGVVGVAEAQRVHHEHRPGAHREDVAHDAADAGGRALVGLDVARVVVRLDLEGDGQALADVDDAGVLAHADEHPVALGQLAELAQVHLGALVGAVLAPHDRVHRQLGLRRPAAEHLADRGVLVVLQPELGVRLLEVGVLRGELDGVDRGHASTRLSRTEVKKTRPSVPAVPMRSSTACSGCGMIPTTLPRSLRIPAMSRALPLGLLPR